MVGLPTESSNTVATALIGVGTVAACGIFGGWLMALAGARGARLLGGLLAGIVLGPAIAGAVWPNWHEKLIEGAVAETAALDQAQRAVAARMLAETAAGAPSNPGESKQEQERIAEAKAALVAARQRDALPRNVALAVLASLVLVGLAPRRTAKGGQPSPLAMRVFVAVVPATGALLFAWWWLGSCFSGAALVTIAATCCGVGVLSSTHRRICDRLSLLEPETASSVWRDGRLAMLLAGVVLLLAMSEHITIDAPLTLVWISTTALAFVAMSRVRETQAASRQLARVANTVAVPAMAALAACAVPLGGLEWVIPALILAIISGDGRTLGWFLGSVLSTTRPVGRSLMLGAVGAGAAPIQAAFTAAAIALNLIPGWLGFSLLSAALSTDLLVMPDRLGPVTASAPD